MIRYLSGNFAPIQTITDLVPCRYSGILPGELAGGEYVRNGGNPVTNEALGRDAHWFDGDGMLTGVSFRRSDEKGAIEPAFVNQYILTDVYLSTKTTPSLRTPILPSIATLVNPMSSFVTIILRILRTILLVILSHLPGSLTAIKRISVANTAVLYHDGRALATCESGPPMRISLPGLETIGWFNGIADESENGKDVGPGFGGRGNALISFMKEWTTAHVSTKSSVAFDENADRNQPRVDPNTQELILYHSTFIPPYVNYSIVQPSHGPSPKEFDQKRTPTLNVPIPGITSAKMMHDFGVSSTHTIIMDLPLSLDPLNLARGQPVVAYDPSSRSRFGVFPRYKPQEVCWFETNPCCIFHTANSWDSLTPNQVSGMPPIETVNMLACRLTSASLVFSAGDIAAPVPTHKLTANVAEEEQCRLYFYQFCLPQNLGLNASKQENIIAHQWALSAIPFEFPSLRDSMTMSAARYIYGCSVSDTSFGAALGRAVKINALVKVDVATLIEKGTRDPPTQITGCVDTRCIAEVVASSDPMDPIKAFKMPEGWYAQEPRFVPRSGGIDEDDGWILSYIFDESQLDEDGECKPNAASELWIIDAKNMTDVVAKIHLPQRVPYGLHGTWFSEANIQSQRPVKSIRTLSMTEDQSTNASLVWSPWIAIRKMAASWLG